MASAWIAPSILSADFARLGEEVDAVLAAGADLVHFDVMDNHYVPNLTIGPLVCEALRKHGVKAPIDVHLMVQPVDRIVPDFAAAGRHLHQLPPRGERARRPHHRAHPRARLQARAWCSIRRPRSTTSTTRSRSSTWCCIMSVNPGFGGQKFIPDALAQARRGAARASMPPAATVRLEVDGGDQGRQHRARSRSAGADTFVAGSAIFGSKDYARTIREMRQQITL